MKFLDLYPRAREPGLGISPRLRARVTNPPPSLAALGVRFLGLWWSVDELLF